MLLNSNNREFYNDIVAKIIEYIKQYKYLDVVEADLFIGISSRKDDHAVDVLVDGVKYIDDDSFGIDYSEPVRSLRAVCPRRYCGGRSGSRPRARPHGGDRHKALFG